MTKLWYNNFSVLLDNPYQFFPSNNLNQEEKINAIIRLAIYFSIIIIILGKNLKWLSVSVVLILFSFFLKKTEKFQDVKKNKIIDGFKCYPPTDDNPFMNFTLKDYYNDPLRPSNCPIDIVKKDIRKKFLKNIVPDPMDLWGTNVTDRSFYTMPNTQIVNDQKGFAEWCYGNSNNCKSSGLNCLMDSRLRPGTSMYAIS